MEDRTDRIKLYKEIRDILNILISTESEVTTKLYKLQPGEVFSTECGKFMVLRQSNNSTLVSSNGLYYDKDINEYFNIRYDSHLVVNSLKYADIMKICNDIYLNKLCYIFGKENIVRNKASLIFKNQSHSDWYVRPMIEDEWKAYNQLFFDTLINNGFWLLNVDDDLKNVRYVDTDRVIKSCRQKGENGLLIVFELANNIIVNKPLLDYLQDWNLSSPDK